MVKEEDTVTETLRLRPMGSTRGRREDVPSSSKQDLTTDGLSTSPQRPPESGVLTTGAFQVCRS